MSRLVFRNETDYPEEEVRRLVRYAAADLDLPHWGNVITRIRYTRPRGSGYSASGHAYSYVFAAADVPEGTCWEIRLRLARGGFPYAWPDRRQEPVGQIADWREALVVIAAHELKHIETYQRIPRGSIGRKGKAAEDVCDAYAAHRIRAFREGRP